MIFKVLKCLSNDIFIIIQAWACSCTVLHLNTLLPPWWFFPEETKIPHSVRWKFLYNRWSPAFHLSWVATVCCQRLLFLPPTIPVYYRQSGLNSAKWCHTSGKALTGAGYFTWKMGKMGKDKTQKIQENTFKFLTFYHSKHNPKSLNLCLLCAYSITIYMVLQWQPYLFRYAQLKESEDLFPTISIQGCGGGIEQGAHDLWSQLCNPVI